MILTFIAHRLCLWAPGNALEGGLSDSGLTPGLQITQYFENNYWRWLWGWFYGAWGTSSIYHTAVSTLVLAALLQTLSLAILAIILAYTLALALGLYVAWNHDESFDLLLNASLLALSTLPSYVAGLLLMLVCASRFYFILAIFCLAYPMLSRLVRFVRQSALNVMKRDFVLQAKARGLPESQVLRRHVLPHTALPLLGLLAVDVPYLLSGSVMLETIFRIQGLGLFAYQALLERDLQILLAIVSVGACLTLLTSFLCEYFIGKQGLGPSR